MSASRGGRKEKADYSTELLEGKSQKKISSSLQKRPQDDLLNGDSKNWDQELVHCKKKGAVMNGKTVLAFATTSEPSPTVYETS